MALFTAQNNVSNDPTPVTDVCLGCICEASSGCDRSLKCTGDVCGLFRITWVSFVSSHGDSNELIIVISLPRLTGRTQEKSPKTARQIRPTVSESNLITLHAREKKFLVNPGMSN